MATYAYCRVSTIDQVDNGNSLEVQRSRIEGEAKSKGLKGIDKFFVDKGISGAKPLADRSNGKKLLDTLKDGDEVIALKLDRMFRSAGDAVQQLEEFKKRKIKLFLLDMGEVTGNGIAAMVFTILSAVAQFERERIAERIAESKALAMSQGRYTGGLIPFGFDIVESDGKKYLKENAEQVKIITEIFKLRDEGLSYKKIAKSINEAFSTKLSHMGIKRVLGRLNMGLKERMNDMEIVMVKEDVVEEYKTESEIVDLKQSDDAISISNVNIAKK